MRRAVIGVLLTAGALVGSALLQGAAAENLCDILGPGSDSGSCEQGFDLESGSTGSTGNTGSGGGGGNTGTAGGGGDGVLNRDVVVPLVVRAERIDRSGGDHAGAGGRGGNGSGGEGGSGSGGDAASGTGADGADGGASGNAGDGGASGASGSSGASGDVCVEDTIPAGCGED
jgi:hypothetical protein